jgi:Rad3-related DNA helicase
MVSVVKGGVLIFFTSYSIMNKCKEEWEKNQILDPIKTRMPIYFECKKKHEHKDNFAKFEAAICSSKYKGCIFAGVFRGKLSEGTDFSDE